MKGNKLMKSAEPTNGKKINLNLRDLQINPDKDPRGGAKKISRPSRDGLSTNHNEAFLKDLTANKDPRGGAKKISRPTPDGLRENHNEMFLAERNVTIKDLNPDKDPRGGVKVSRPRPDGMSNNHNEMFLADLS
jgi:hypothetical protein